MYIDFCLEEAGLYHILVGRDFYFAKALSLPRISLSLEIDG
jgi:hypothetical protein